MKKHSLHTLYFISGIFLLVSVMLISSCSSAETNENVNSAKSNTQTLGILEADESENKPMYQAVDSLGRIVSLTEKPGSIIIAGKATMIAADALTLFQDYRSQISAIGLTNQGLGDFYALLLPDLPLTERLPHTVSAEEIAGLKPDLVIIKDRNYSSLGETLDNLGYPVFSVYLENVDDYLHEIQELGKLLNQKSRADEIRLAYSTRLTLIRESLSSLKEMQRENVLLLYTTITDGITSFQVPPESWIQTYMVEEAGANPVWIGAAGSNNWQKISFEQISQWNPDRIYIISYKTPTNLFMEEIKSSPLWQDLTAYQNNQIKSFPADFHNWAQPDTRWILGLQWLSRDLHPEIFSKVDIEKEIVSFYDDFYGISETSFMYTILDRYRKSLITIE
ncbi:MAG: ABC transporter substrate-binding protein [Bacteroidetes bacterium]|nr:ABC transporter substrate-binding protein [Bacteroidota bacterium]